MSDERTADDRPRRKLRPVRALSVVPPVSHLDAMHPPRTIGRLIAQTALIADTARATSKRTRAGAQRGLRRFGWFT